MEWFFMIIATLAFLLAMSSFGHAITLIKKVEALEDIAENHFLHIQQLEGVQHGRYRAVETTRRGGEGSEGVTT